MPQIAKTLKAAGDKHADRSSAEQERTHNVFKQYGCVEEVEVSKSAIEHISELIILCSTNHHALYLSTYSSHTHYKVQKYVISVQTINFWQR